MEKNIEATCNLKCDTLKNGYSCSDSFPKYYKSNEEENSSNLQRHKKIHTGGNPYFKYYVCYVCDKKFNCSSKLIIHQRITHRRKTLQM